MFRKDQQPPSSQPMPRNPTGYLPKESAVRSPQAAFQIEKIPRTKTATQKPLQQSQSQKFLVRPLEKPDPQRLKNNMTHLSEKKNSQQALAAYIPEQLRRCNTRGSTLKEERTITDFDDTAFLEIRNLTFLRVEQDCLPEGA